MISCRGVGVASVVIFSARLSQAQAGQFRLEVVQSYGAEDPAAGSRLGGASFERIASIRSFPDGRVAVLDQPGKKVALFARNGTFVRTIGLGTGKGPGEFANPIALDVSDGRIAVFDYDGNRVTVFDTLGKVLWMRTTPRAKQILLRGDTLFGTYMPGNQFMLWRQASEDLRSVTRLLEISESTLRDFDPNGVVAMLTRGSAGEMLVADGRPGLWYSVTGAMTRTRGVELLAGSRFIAFEDMQIAPGQACGIVMLSDRHIGIAFTTFARQTNAPPKLATREFAVFDKATGQLLQRFAIAGTERGLPVIGPSFQPNEFLIAREEPYPHVERVAVRGLK